MSNQMHDGFQTYREAVASLTDEQLGAHICSKQRIQMNASPDSQEWRDASALLSVYFAEAAHRSETRGAVIRSL